jgi:hypothetical protein
MEGGEAVSASTNWEDVYRTQTARIAELERENAALRADTERLDWLTNTGCWLTFPVLSKNQNWKHGTARDVIDLARKEAQP